MSAPEIILIVVSASFVLFIFGRMIYRRIKGQNDECNCCKVSKKRMIKDIKKELAKL